VAREPRASQARDLPERGRLEEVDALLRGVLSFAPRSYAALYTLGMIGFQRGDRSPAPNTDVEGLFEVKDCLHCRFSA
jgi:hypothetical protein